MKTCPRCRWEYPDRFIQRLTGNTAPPIEVCAICALAMINLVVGIKRTRFDGEEAERLRQETLRWRKTHKRKAVH